MRNKEELVSILKKITKPSLGIANRVIIKTKNLYWGGLIMAIFIIIATISLSSYQQSKIDSTSTRSINFLTIIEIINDLHVTHQSQVIAWKNILLRGHSSDNLNHNINHFNATLLHFRALLDKFAKTLTRINMLDESIKKDIESIAQAHIELERNYYNALETFSLKTLNAYQKIDMLVKDNDAIIPPILEKMENKLFGQINIEREKTLTQLKNMDYFLGSGLVLSILIFIYTSRLQSKIIRNNGLYQMIAKHSKDGVMVLEKGVVTYISPAYWKILKQEKINMKLEEIFGSIHKDDKDGFEKRFKEAVSSHQKYMIYMYRALHVEGGYRYKEDRISFEYDHLGKVLRIYIFSRDVTLQTQREQKIKESEEKYRALVQLSPDMIFLKDKEFKYLIVNQNLANFLGKKPEQIIGKSDFELMHYDAAQACRVSDIHAFEVPGISVSEEQINGKTYETTKHVLAFQDNNCLAGIIKDVTEKVKDETKIHHLAFYDTLTSLPNRKLFMDRLEHAFIVFRKNHLYGGVVLVDVDNFKIINDTWGHDKGDMLLKEMAVRVKSITHVENTVSRLGGDEFAILFEGLSENQIEAAKIIASMADQIKIFLQQPYAFGENEYLCTVSVGVSLFNANHLESIVFVKEAEIALYKAKEEGRNSIRFFESSMQEQLSMRYVLESSLRNAIKTGGFELYYQPQVDASMRVVGAEALLRWNHEGGVISPSDFIPILEETGLIVQIGEWILCEGIILLERWSKDTQKQNWSLALNVSIKQFEDDNFIKNLYDLVGGKAFNRSKLKLEITESLFLKKTKSSIDKIKQIREMGIEISLDDFGTGYSSLSYLKHIPITQLKIDQSFIGDILKDGDTQIIEMIITVAKNMKISLVAEGVESFEQFQWLAAHGCEYFQGFYIDRPQKLEMFEKKWSQFSA